MIPRLLIPTLLALPLCAQTPAPASAPAVHFILQADPPSSGTPALDVAAISNAFQDFAKEHHLVRPAQGGDGWVLGVRLTAQHGPEGLLAAAGALRLSHLKGGQIEQASAKEDIVAAEAREAPQLASALARELVRRAQRLLSTAQVLPGLASDPKAPVVVTESGGRILDIDFSKVGVAYTPPQRPYPPDAKVNHVEGTVVLEVTTNTLGAPESVTAISGPGPLLAYAMEWAMRFRFNPLEVNAKPVRARFPFNMDFRLQ